MQLVAEGVETKETMERLREYGCDNVQGYYYSRPLPAKAFIEWTNHELPQWKH
jgi:EAL domain-containing protein (putative c-di-GMP-specific phosphodiesterase class I)